MHIVLLFLVHRLSAMFVCTGAFEYRERLYTIFVEEEHLDDNIAMKGQIMYHS